MEERQVTVDGTTYALEPPFMVIATQNPLEMDGTYSLPRRCEIDRTQNPPHELGGLACSPSCIPHWRSPLP
jgi:MoxR-like ATPase